MSVVVKTDPVLEAIARKLQGFGLCPADEQARMIKRAAKAGAKALRENENTTTVDPSKGRFRMKRLKLEVVSGLLMVVGLAFLIVGVVANAPAAGKVSGRIDLGLNMTYTGTNSAIVNPSESWPKIIEQIVKTGTGKNQFNQMRQTRTTLTANQSLELDLDGGLTDSFGNTINIGKLKLLCVKVVASTNALSIGVGGAATNQLSLFNNTNDILNLAVEQTYFMYDPSGITVSNGVSDLLGITNHTTFSTAFDLFIVGD